MAASILKVLFGTPKRIIVTVLVVIIFFWLLSSDEGLEVTEDTAFFELVSGPLTISLKESGTLHSQKQYIIKNEAPRERAITWIVDEGKVVKEGDLLVELESDTLKEKLIEQEIRVESAEADFIGAQEVVKITKNDAINDIAQAELDLKTAVMNLNKFKEGEYPQKMKELNNEITIAKEEIQRAEEKSNWSSKLEGDGYITRTELQGDKLAYKRKQLALELAEKKLKVYETYTYPMELARLEMDIKQKRSILEIEKLDSEADQRKVESAARTKEINLSHQKRSMEELKEHIEKCTIVSPADGMVIYATNRRRRDDGPLAVGQKVDHRQQLIKLPTDAGMKAEIKVQEINIRQIDEGMPARITVNALPELSFKGHIEKIAPLPDQTNRWYNPDLRVFKTEVYLDDADPRLRSEMSCQVEIIIKEFKDTLYVPVQAVMIVEGQHTAYVKDGSTLVPTKVELGLTNNRMVQILSGLEEGDEVSLSPPMPDAEKVEKVN